MVVKTELCAFSEFRIYPGHGIKFIRRDGQPVILGTSKSKRLSIVNKKKPAKLMWTQSWRRLNKKGKDEGATRKRVRRVVRVQKAVGGLSLEDLKKRVQPVKPKSVATEAALKEVKERSKGKKNFNRGGPAQGANVPKLSCSHLNKNLGCVRCRAQK